MTESEFRELALSYPGAEENSHVNHPDFRVRGRIFATLGFPDSKHGVLMLTPETQKDMVGNYPKVFSPAPGVWGLRGNTIVLLARVEMELLRKAMTIAWKKVAPKEKKVLA